MDALIPQMPHERSDDSLEDQLARHHADAFQWARICCAGGAEAADVLQAAYVRILGGRAKFGGRSSFKTWLLGVVRWVAVEETRKHGRRHERFTVLDFAADIADPAPRVDAALADGERAARLLALLDALPPRQQEVLHLVFHQELSIQQAAEALGVSVGTACQHYERGKATLRREWSFEESDRAPAPP